jgi:hypothetical protein
MKRLLVLLMALTVAIGGAAAQEEEGNGFTLGLEFGIGGLGADSEGTVYLSPIIAFEKSFLDGAFDVYAELDYIINFDEDVTQDLYVNFGFGYNLGLGDIFTLSFLLDTEYDTVSLNPGGAFNDAITPGLKGNFAFDFGDIYAQLGLPINFENSDTGLGLGFTLGWSSAFGLGVECTLNLDLSPDAGYGGLDAIVSYGAESWYVEVEVNTGADADAGITITPTFEYYLNSFTFYV